MLEGIIIMEKILLTKVVDYGIVEWKTKTSSIIHKEIELKKNEQ